MNSPDPTVEIWQQRPLLEEEIFVRRLPFPDQAGRGSVKALIAIDGAIAFTLSPRIALGLPLVIVATVFVVAATVYLFYRPMVGVYAAILCVPAEAFNLSFGSFGLTPTKAILVLVGGVVLARFLMTGRMRTMHPAYVAFLIGQVITILGLLVARDTFVVLKIWVIWSAFLAVSMLVASASARQVKTILYCLSVAGPILAVESISHGGQQRLINGGLEVTERAQGSFTHPAELAVYNARTGQEMPLFPRKPFQAIRSAYGAKLAEFYRTHEDWCMRNNHPCDPESMDSSVVGEVATSAQEHALAFVISYDAIQEFPGDLKTPPGPGKVVYIYRHVDNEATLEYRELLLSDIEARFGNLPLRSLLEPEKLQQIFAK